MNSLKNGLLIVLSIVTINIFAAEGGDDLRSKPFESIAREGGAAGGAAVQAGAGPAQEGIAPEGHVRIILSDGTTQDYPNNELANFSTLIAAIEFKKEQGIPLAISMGGFFQDSQDLEGRFELAVKISNATQENVQEVMAELEARSFGDILIIGQILDFFMFEDTKNLGLENKITDILYAKYQALTVAECVALDVSRLHLKKFYGINEKCKLPIYFSGNEISLVSFVSLSPNGLLMAARKTNFNLQLYDISHDQLRPIGSAISDVQSASLSSNGLMAVLDRSLNLQLYDVSQDQLRPVGHAIPGVRSASLSSDGSLIGVIRNTDLQLYHVSNQQPVGNPILNVLSFSFSPNGLLMLVMHRNGLLQLYHVSNQQPVGNPIQNLRSFSFSPDGLLIVAKNNRFELQLYRVSDQQLVGPVGNVIRNVWSFSFSPDGSLIGIVDTRHNLQLCSLDGQQLMPLLENPIPRLSFVYFNSNGLMIAIDSNSNLKLFNQLLQLIIKKIEQAAKDKRVADRRSAEDSE